MEGFIFQYGSKQKLMNASSADIVRYFIFLIEKKIL